MQPSSIKLTLFPIDDITNWFDRFARATSALHHNAVKRHSSLLVWNPKDMHPIRKRIYYVDGWIIFRVWLGPKMNGIGINPQRLYFQDNMDFPISIPEGNLIKDEKPPMPGVHTRISGCLRLAKAIEPHVSGFHGDPMPIVRCRQLLHEKTFIVFGNAFKTCAGGRMGNLLMNHGFFHIPIGFEIIISTENIHHASVLEYEKHLESAMKRCSLDAKVSIMSYRQTEKEFLESELDKKEEKTGKALLIAISGRRGEELPALSDNLLQRLTLKGIPFRLFSTDNRSLQWSALDQLGSLLQAGGGVPYTLELPWPKAEIAPFFLGVDLGHPLFSRHSWITFSLVDNQGIHLESRKCNQARDETARLDVLLRSLRWARETIQMNTDGMEKDIIIIRDGRLHKGEQVETYKQNIPSKITFVEIAKNNNPEMFIEGAEYRAVPAGTECIPQGCTTPFVVCVAPRRQEELPRVFKINAQKNWDDLGLGIDTVVDIVVGLSYSPGLGLQPHALPAPLYWADGISAISNTNHQFAGQSYVEDVLA